MGNHNRHFFGSTKYTLLRYLKNAPKPTICWKKKRNQETQTWIIQAKNSVKIHHQKTYTKMSNIFQLNKNIFPSEFLPAPTTWKFLKGLLPWKRQHGGSKWGVWLMDFSNEINDSSWWYQSTRLKNIFLNRGIWNDHLDSSQTGYINFLSRSES